MKPERDDIIKELEVLEAARLLKIKQETGEVTPSAHLEEKLIQGVLQARSQMEKDVKSIDIKEGMRREKIKGFSFFLRIAATVAVIVTTGYMGYKVVSQQGNGVDCNQNPQDLACIVNHTTDEEIYQYLQENTRELDEESLLQLIETDTTTYYELELQ